MGKTMFLEFDGVYISDGGSENLMFVDEINNHSFLHLEDMAHQIRSIITHLSMKKFSSDFGP